MSRWNNEEIERGKNLLCEGKTYEEIALDLNRTVKSVKLKLNKSGVKFSDFQKPKEVKLCQCCGGEILGSGIKYCSSSCSATINNLKYPKRSKQIILDGKKIRIKTPLNNCSFCGEECIKKYCSIRCQKDEQQFNLIEGWKSGTVLGYKGKTMQIKPFIRNFLLKEENFKCSKCGWDKLHPVTGKSTLEINHIDGDAENCKIDNLEVICPNCHSLTPNFRALNKNSKRNRK